MFWNVGSGRVQREKVFLACLFSILCTCTKSYAPNVCPENYFSFLGRCWFYSGDSLRRTWYDADSYCQTGGGRLISLHDDEESEKAWLLCKDNNAGWGRTREQRGVCWMGLFQTQGQSGREFQWIDGTPFLKPGGGIYYENFAPNEPNNVGGGGEDCVHNWDRAKSRGMWNDEPCSRKYPFLCVQNALCPSGAYEAAPYAPWENIAADCQECPPGTYDNSPDGGIETCFPCEQGMYCHSGFEQGECDIGYYCESGASTPTQRLCPAGVFGNETALGNPVCSGDCSPGFYCEEGSTTPEQFPCAAGRWGAPGQTDALCSGPCVAGYFCTEASPSSSQNECGGAHVYCPQGSSKPRAVSAGYFSTPEEESAINTRTSQSICPKGHYCQDGVKRPCPSGTYGPVNGLETCDEYVCAEGYFCDQGSLSPAAGPCYPDVENPPEHPAIYYCPAGTSFPLAVDKGYYSVPENAAESQRSGQELANPALYLVRNGKRELRVEWLGVCANGAGTASVLELTNYGAGRASGGASIALLEPQDNMAQTPLLLSQITLTGATVQACADTSAAQAVAHFQIRDGDSSLDEIDGLPYLAVHSNLSLDHEACDSFELVLTARSLDGNITSDCLLSVKVENANDKPYFGARDGASYPNAEPETTTFQVFERSELNTAVGFPMVASDEDIGQEFFFKIEDSLDASDGMFYIGSCSGQIYVLSDGLDFVAKSEYNLEVTVCDDPQFFGEGTVAQCSVTVPITISVQDLNDPPYFANQPFRVTGFQVAEDAVPGTLLQPLCAAADEDPDSPGSPCASLGFHSVQNLVVQDLDLDAQGDSKKDVMRFRVITGDAGNGAQSPEYPINVIDCNRVWNLDECEVAIGNASSAAAGTLIVTAFNASEALNFEVQPLVMIRVEVSDGRGGVAERIVPIMITDANDAPEWPQGDQLHLSFRENDAAASQAIYASDEDGDDVLDYTMLGVFDVFGDPAPGLFFIDPLSAPESSPVTLKANVSLDHEASSSYHILVRATDAQGLFADANFTIHVEDENERPEIQTEVLFVSENLPPGSLCTPALQFMDVDAQQELIVSADSGAHDGRIFSVDSVGNVTALSSFDFESNKNYTLRVRVRDNGQPSLQIEKDITIAVTNVAEPPRFEPLDQHILLAEPTEFNSSWSATIGIIDEDSGQKAGVSLELVGQEIASTGQPVHYFTLDGLDIKLNASHEELPNFESPLFPTSQKAIKIILRATTDATGMQSGDVGVLIELENVNDAPVMSTATVLVSKHTYAFEPCTSATFCQPGAVVIQDVAELCSDEDSVNAAVDIEIVGGNDDGVFNITEEGALVINAITDDLTSSGHSFQLSMVCTDQNVLLRPWTPLSSAPAILNVLVSEVDYPPQISVGHELVLSENTAFPKLLIADIGASDPEGSVLAFDLFGAEPPSATNAFSINATTGQLWLNGTLDFETMADELEQVRLLVRVQDNNGLPDGKSSSAISTVTINVTDVQEPPMFAQPFYEYEVFENESPGIISALSGIGAVAIDQDAADIGLLEYHIVGNETRAPTSAPTTSPTYCNVQHAELDIVWVLDESGSVRASNYELLKDFIETVSDSFTISANYTRMGVVEFSNRIGTVKDLNAASSNSAWNDIVNNLQFNGGATSTKMVIQYLNDEYFTRANNVPRGGLTRRAVVIATDGNPSSGQGGSRLIHEVTELLQGDTDRFVFLKIGNGINPNLFDGARGYDQSLDAIHADFSKLDDIFDQLVTIIACETGPREPAPGKPPFQVNLDSGDISQNGRLDFEVPLDGRCTLNATSGDHFCNIQLQVTDSVGLTANTTIRVRVRNQNEAPVFSGSACAVSSSIATCNGATISLKENAYTSGLLKIATLSSTDQDRDAGIDGLSFAKQHFEFFQSARDQDGVFYLDDAGNLFVTNDLDFENRSKYEYVVRLFDEPDSEQAQQEDIFLLTINVEDVNDIGIITASSPGPWPVTNSIFATLTGDPGAFGPTAYKRRTEGTNYPYYTAWLENPATGQTFTTTACSPISDTELRCSSPLGVGEGFFWRVLLNGYGYSGYSSTIDSNDVSKSTRFESPLILAVTGATTLPTAGGAALTVRGKNFGGTLSSISMQDIKVELFYKTLESPNMPYEAQGCTLTYDASAVADGFSEVITCAKSDIGTGRNLVFKVHVAGQESSGWFGPFGVADLLWLNSHPVYKNRRKMWTVCIEPPLDSGLSATSSDCFGETNATFFKEAFHTKLAASMLFSYSCEDCASTHRKLVYKRLTPLPANIHEIIFEHWTEDDNQLGVDFELYSSLGDAFRKENSWLFCGYNETMVGFPGTCGPSGPSQNQWLSVDRSLWHYGDLGEFSHEEPSLVPFVALPVHNSTVNSSNIVSVAQQVALTNDQDRMNTKGGSLGDGLIFRGSNFGPLNGPQVIVVTYGPANDLGRFEARDCKVSVAHTEIRCRYVQGAGENLRFILTIDGVVSSSPSQASLSYYGPVIENIGGPGSENARTKGGDVVFIQGSGFGPIGTRLVATYGGTEADQYAGVNCEVVQADSLVQCETASGTGRGHGWRVYSEGQPSSVWFGEDGQGTSYSPPTINFFEGIDKNAVSEGGERVTLVGIDFGDDSKLVSATFGMTGSEFQALDCKLASDFLHTKIHCTLPAGIGGELKWTVFVDGQASKVPTTNYKRPVVDAIDNVTITGASTSGGELFRIRGWDFGPKVLHSRLLPKDQYRFTYGPVTGFEFEATNCSVAEPPKITLWTSYLSVAENISLSDAYFRINVGEMAVLINFDESAQTLETNLKTVLGLENTTSSQVRVSRSSSPFSHNCTDSCHEWIISSTALPRKLLSLPNPLEHTTDQSFLSSYAIIDLLDEAGNLIGASAGVHIKQPRLGFSSVTCRTAEGVGEGLRFVAHIGNQMSSLSVAPATLSYAPPSIEYFDPPMGVSSQEFVLNIYGTNFGTGAAGIGGDSLRVLFEGQALEVEQHTHIQLTVRIPESLQRNGNRSLTIEVGRQQVVSWYSFQRPKVLSVSAVNPPQNLTGPPQEILIRGESFGVYMKDFDAVSIGNTTCLISEWTHTSIRCNITSLEGPLSVQVGEQVCQDTLDLPPSTKPCCPCDFSYEGLLTSPFLTSISTCGILGVNTEGCATNGGYPLIIYGKGFGTHIHGKVLVHGRECIVENGDEDYTETEIRCIIPPGEGHGLVQVRHAWKQSQEEVPFYYDLPRLETLWAPRGPTKGGTSITIQGENFGVHGPSVWFSSSSNLTLKDSICQIIEFDHDRLICSTPAGQGIVSVMLQVGGQEAPTALSFDYFLPQVRSISPGGGSTEGNFSVEILGDNFGVTGAALIGGRNCLGPDTEYSHERIVCAAPPGTGSNVSIAIDSGGRITTADSSDGAYFAYDRPELVSLNPPSGPTDGGELIVIEGKNFGYAAGATPNVRMGDYACTNVAITSSTHLQCDSPVGIGQNLSTVVVVDDQESTSHADFSFEAPRISQIIPFPVLLSNEEPQVTIALPPVQGGFNNTEEGDGEVVLVPTVVGGTFLTLSGHNFGNAQSDPGAPGLSVSIVLENPVAFEQRELQEAEVVPWEEGPQQPIVCRGTSRTNDRSISCYLPKVPVGRHGIHLKVATQSFWVEPGHVNSLSVGCQAGHFGQPREACESCPYGATCLGYTDNIHHEPVSSPGYGSLNRTLFQLCEPGFACLGNDTCAVGYEHKNPELRRLCAKCAEDFYRLNGECVPCPDLAWLILIACFALAAMLCSIAYFLTKYGVQLAAVSICIDFCQVVSLFASYDFEWPRAVTSAYSVLSAFNLNLELASPECSVGWDYETKWYIMYFMPLMFGGIFMVSFVYTWVKNAIRNALRKAREQAAAAVVPVAHVARRMSTGNAKLASPQSSPRANNNDEKALVKSEANHRAASRATRDTGEYEEKVLLVDEQDMDSYDASFNRFIDAEFGAFLIMLYYLYLSIMKKCLETFRCTDGTVPVLRAEPSEPCTDEGTFFPTIRSLAVFGIFIYGAGLPILLTYLLLKHSSFIQQDQRRREKALHLSEDSAAISLQKAFRGYYVRRVVDPRAILRRHKTLTNIGRTRAKFGKLYEDFTSDCYYWRLVLMLRKLVLVMITMFLDDKFKQSTLAFGVLFASYAVHVRKRPYLSRFADDREERKQSKAFIEWKRRTDLRSDLKTTKGRLRQMQTSIRQSVQRTGARVGIDINLGLDDERKELIRSHMAFNKLEINKKTGEGLRKRINAKNRATAESEQPENHELLKSAVEQRWGLVKAFVQEPGVEKFVVPSQLSQLKGEAWRWLFDYNSLETISLATLMYILLFGLLFDTYAADRDTIRINILAGLTIAVFVIVICLFMSSVVLDVKRKFYPALREKISKEGWRAVLLTLVKRGKQKSNKINPGSSSRRGLLNKGATDKSLNVLIPPRRGQWVSPVNPFATLEKQNSDLVHAEETRLSAIMASKNRHREELAERERTRAEQRQVLEEQYRAQMERVEAELAEIEAQNKEEETALKLEIEEELAAKAQSIERELEAKLKEIASSPTSATAMERRDAAFRAQQEKEAAVLRLQAATDQAEDELVNDLQAREHDLFQAEEIVLRATVQAEKQERLANLEERFYANSVGALNELASFANSVRESTRRQQEEIIARLQDRKLRKVPIQQRRQRPEASELVAAAGIDKSDSAEATQEIESLYSIEDKLVDLTNEHLEAEDEIQRTSALDFEGKEKELRASVAEAIRREDEESTVFEKHLAEELDVFDADTAGFAEKLDQAREVELKDIQSKLGDDGIEDDGQSAVLLSQIRDKYETSMESLKVKRNEERVALLAKLEDRRKRRNAEMLSKAEAEENKRDTLLTAAQEKMQQSKLRIVENSSSPDKESIISFTPREEADRVRAEFERNQAELAGKLSAEKDERRKALDKRIKARAAAAEARKKQLALQKETDAAEAAAKLAKEVLEAGLGSFKDTSRVTPDDISGSDASGAQDLIEKIKRDAREKKVQLEADIQAQKTSQRAKVLERLAAKKRLAEEKRMAVLAEKRKDQVAMEEKQRAEEDAMRERQAQEIEEIEQAHIDVLLDKSNSEALAEGVAAWRKHKEEQERALANQAPKRSAMLLADFKVKSQRIENVESDIAKDKAELDQLRQDGKPDEKLEAAMGKREASLGHLVKELAKLYESIVEELKAELNQQKNDAALQKARTQRKLQTLQARFGLSPLSPASPTSPSSTNGASPTRVAGQVNSSSRAVLDLGKINF